MTPRRGASTMGATRRLLQSHRPGGDPLRVLGASGQLGFGIAQDGLMRGLQRRPHLIGCDMGSIDPGPYYLATGEMAAPREMALRDLELVLDAALSCGAPLIIGSAGTAGAAPHLGATRQLIEQISLRRGWRFRMVTVRTDVQASEVIRARSQGRLEPIGPMPLPSEQEIEDCGHIVGQCGVQTLRRALELDPDVLLVGRACDTAIFAALPIMLGYSAALSLHMAKIIECASLCCEPAGRDPILAELDEEGFVLESMNPQLRATPLSVAAHSLYEQADPFVVDEPDGVLQLDAVRCHALDERRTRVEGARFSERARPSLKIEGAAAMGWRVVLMAGVADPGLIGRLQEVLRAVELKVRALADGSWSVHPRIYGLGAVRDLAPALHSTHEVGLLLEFVAPEPDRARAVAAVFRQHLLHHGFEGRMSTAGNLAFAFTPPELDAGRAARFLIYHVMHDTDLEQRFPTEVCEVGGDVAPVPAASQAPARRPQPQ